jgi:hypothetical protein
MARSIISQAFFQPTILFILLFMPQILSEGWTMLNGIRFMDYEVRSGNGPVEMNVEEVPKSCDIFYKIFGAPEYQSYC